MKKITLNKYSLRKIVEAKDISSAVKEESGKIVEIILVEETVKNETKKEDKMIPPTSAIGFMQD